MSHHAVWRLGRDVPDQAWRLMRLGVGGLGGSGRSVQGVEGRQGEKSCCLDFSHLVSAMQRELPVANACFLIAQFQFFSDPSAVIHYGQLRARCGHRAACILRGVNHMAITGNRSRLAILNLCATGVHRDTRMVVPVARTAVEKVIAIRRNVDVEEGSDVS